MGKGSIDCLGVNVAAQTVVFPELNAPERWLAAVTGTQEDADAIIMNAVCISIVAGGRQGLVDRHVNATRIKGAGLANGSIGRVAFMGGIIAERCGAGARL